MDNRMLLKKDLKEKRELINITMDRYLPRKDEYPKDIHKAIRHSLFAGGKRLRPYLCIRAYNLFTDDLEIIRPVAASIEMLHTYTLIHDDLPSIDDDDYRRGKKACHVLFGEDIALLAGDALLTFAFDMLSTAKMDDAYVLNMIGEMAHEAGYQRLIAGQMADILSEGKKPDAKTLTYIHNNKTGRLLTLCLRFGAYTAQASADDIARLEKFGEKLGLAFQIVDDVLDIEGNTKTLGKTTGKDDKVKKLTFPALYGLEESKTKATQLIDEAKALLEPYGERALLLHLLADYILNRKL